MYTLIESNQQLAELCRILDREKEVALDLEADSLHHYREKVCLVQVSNRSATWLIDPLQVSDLSPLGSLLAKKELQTVFHGGDYDIRSLQRDFGIRVANMFDTMIAAQFTGITEFGLAALLRSHFGIELDKRYQKADWSQRPLTTEMANYAAHDTAHLLPLADQLRGSLKRLGRTDWVAEECALVAGNRMPEKGDGPLYAHCKGTGRLAQRSLAILEELLRFRDEQAQALDRPPFKVIPTESLVALAEKKTTNVHEMSKIPGLTPRILKRYGAELAAAIERGRTMPEDQLPRFNRSKGEPNPGIKARIKWLKQWRDSESKRLELPPGLIAPNWLLEKIAEQRPTSIEQLAAIQGIRRWQLKQWGTAVLEELAKQ